MQKTPVLMYTDIGDDIDDSLALTYLVGCPQIDVVGIICDHKDIAYSEQVAKDLLACLHAQIPVFSQEEKKSFFASIETSIRELVVLSIGPTTQFALDLESHPGFSSAIKRIYFQGQICREEDIISPDANSYNFAQDMESISQIFSHNLPMTFVGKFAAYECPFFKEDILSLAQRYPGVGELLCAEGQKWKERLQSLNPQVFARIYGNNPDVISFPYDLLTAMAITHPEQFMMEKIGGIELIGETPDEQSLKDVALLKSLL